ncbi:MAG: DUF1207 domain-containing protein [Candidatus Rokubacteria bacterium]|nr:DUF1207 domain-containing protein [Candidatus Rokubacteria bacterium]
MSVLLCVVVSLLVAGTWSSAGAAPPAPDDAYAAGYAAAVLEREFKLNGRSLSVQNGVLTLSAADLAGADRTKVVAALSGIRGVMRVEVREPPRQPAPSVGAAGAAAAGAAGLETGLMPPGHLFKPLLADPRWPHFSAAYRHYIDNRELQDALAVSFGETFPLFRGNAPASQWELGVQAGVFALFDFNAGSNDLINADYFVAGFGGYRRGPLSALGRVFHQSSHVGDELLVRTRLQRINLSYEGVDLKLSYDLPLGFRVYGGGGYLFDRDPADLKPWSAQSGAEFRSPWTLAGGTIRPIAALDLQSREENDWNLDLSLRAGVDFESVRVLGRDLQLVLEYFRGNSSDGQFYRQEVEFIGLGAHFHF